MKNSLIVSLIIFIFTIEYTNSQLVRQWEATYNGPANYEDLPNDVAVDANGNVFTTGRSRGINTGNADIATIKYNPAGVMQWVERYNGLANGYDNPYKMLIDMYNNIYIVGVSEPDLILLKYNNNGSLLFAQRISGNGGLYYIKMDNSGNIFACGFHNDSLILIKYNSSGQNLWISHYSYPGSTSSSAVSLDFGDMGNIYVCGRADLHQNALSDALIVKFNNNGGFLWSRTYNSIFNSYEGFYDLTVLNDGSVVAGGHLADSNSFDRGLLNKYSSLGILQWIIIEQSMGVNFVKSDDLDNIYLGVNYFPGTGQHGAGIIKYNKLGERKWVRYHLPHPGFNEGIWDMEVKNCFNLYINYLSYHVDSSTYFGISKYNSNGSLKWEYSETGQVYINDTTFATGSTCLALDNNRNVYVARTGVSALRYNDFHTIKYSDTFYTVSGQVTYRDNNQPVESGFVKALYYDESTASLVTVDSTIILPGGYYTLTQMPPDSLDIMFYQNDDLLQFVPTYYVSTIDWREATKVYATQNLTNINGQVYRINNQANPYNLSGNCVQNINIFLKDAIVYAKIGNEFKNYGISDANGLYVVTQLPAGTYTVIAHRFGYEPLTRNLNLSGNLNGINFNFGYPIGVSKNRVSIPSKFNLSQNYPNPFNPSTRVNFDLPKSTGVKLTIFDMLGREIEILVNEKLNAGSYSVNWNASGYSSGIYFYRIEAGDYIKTRKMILIK